MNILTEVRMQRMSLQSILYRRHKNHAQKTKTEEILGDQSWHKTRPRAIRKERSGKKLNPRT